jgi:CelD/BcsL family acetyltransferase involved in cellulose biosynthesis
MFQIDHIGEPDEFFDPLHKQLKRVLRYKRSLEREHQVELIFADHDNISQEIDQIFELFNKRWQDKKGVEADATADHQFLRSLAPGFLESGHLDAISLKVDGQTIAGVCSLRYGKIMTGYIQVFDPAWQKYSPGWIIIFESIVHAIELGCEVFNLGVGGFGGYKMYLHPQEAAVFSWRYARKNPLSRALLSSYVRMYHRQENSEGS